MYGAHAYDVAKRLAEEKTTETNVEHLVIADPDNAGLYTVARSIIGLNGQQFANLLKGLKAPSEGDQ